MRWFWIPALFLIACASESSPSPVSGVCESPSDCTDPARPFCVQGACHACDGPSACTPELPRCAVDELVCSACTDDPDCSRYPDTPRCGPGGACVGCVSDAQCANPAPVCDSGAQACRGCEADAECASLICETDTGVCTPEEDVLYAAPTGSASSSCTRSEPCTLERAITLAMTSSADLPTLLMLPGTYTSPMAVSSGQLKVLAHDATLERSLTISNARLTLHGLEIENAGITCGVGSALVLEDVTVRNPSAPGLLFQAACDVRAQRTQITGTESVRFVSGGSFEGDRVRLAGSVVMNERGRLTLLNSILEGAVEKASIPADVSASFRFSTIILRDQQFLDCRHGTGGWSLGLRYSIVYSRGIPQFGDVVYNPPGMFTACAVGQILRYPQTTGAVNPLFVDVSSGDYRLQATSPAIDAAMPSPGMETDHDHAGTPRPQGGGYDIGAFERVP